MADSKITALTAISTVDPTADPLVIVDVSDTSMAASGTTKKSTINQLLGAGGTATLASATISGDLTVDTNVLKVNTTTNRVGINTTTPTQNLEITGSGNPLVVDGCSAVRLNNTVSGRPAVVGVDDSQNFVIWNVGTEASETIKFLTGGGNGKEQYRITHGGLFNWYDGAGGTRMTLNSTGLGVGASPVVPLHIYSGGTGTTDFGNVVGTFRTGASGRAVALQFSDTSNLANIGMLSGALQFAAGGSTTHMTISTSGNVGIGVTPSALTNVNRLEIGGQLSSNVTLRSTSTSSSARNWMVGANMNSFGDFVIRQGNSQGAEPNSGTDRLVIDLDGNPIFTPSSTPATLTTNGQLTVNATSNTNLRFSYRGSDGVTRVANITLA